MKLTPNVLEGLKPDRAKRLEIRDDDEPGLLFRITPAGVRSWSMRYVNAAGEHRRKTLGGYPTIGLARARILARKAKGEIAEKVDVVGRDKATKIEAERERLEQLDLLADSYFADAERGTHRARSRPKKPKELKREQDLYGKCIRPVFGDRPIGSITRREIVDFVMKMTKAAGSRGRKCHALVSQLFSYAVLKDIVPANIALGIPVVIPGERERVFSDAEVRTIWHALDNPGAVGSNQSVAMALAQQFLASTVQRSGQVLAMKWTEIDFAERVWKCPSGIMKKSRAHLVPLSDLAMHILHEADQSIGDATYVFASPETGQPMRVDAASRAFARLTARLGIEDAALHDFRRTATTAMTGRLDVPEFIAGKVMSHGKDGRNVTAKHYNMHEYLPEKTGALTRWAALLADLVSDHGNVVLFPARTA